jgi:hypothetical protein
VQAQLQAQWIIDARLIELSPFDHFGSSVIN